MGEMRLVVMKCVLLSSLRSDTRRPDASRMCKPADMMMGVSGFRFVTQIPTPEWSEVPSCIIESSSSTTLSTRVLTGEDEARELKKPFPKNC